jgi:hypothetical protein
VQSVLVFILAIMWSVYLGMWLLSRRERRSLNSIATFHKHLAVLGRTAPGRSSGAGREPGRRRSTMAHPGPARPRMGRSRRGGMTLAEARSRRRQVVTVLAAGASVTAAAAFVAGGALLAVHLGFDVVLVGYLLLLANARQVAVERRSKVVYFPRQVTPVAFEPAYLRRSAN